MKFLSNTGFMKVVQKIILIALTVYIDVLFSSFVPSCRSSKTGWNIYPFDRNFFESSVLFMASAAITVVELDIWPYSTKPCNKILKYVGEVRLYIFFYLRP